MSWKNEELRGMEEEKKVGARGLEEENFSVEPLEGDISLSKRVRFK